MRDAMRKLPAAMGIVLLIAGVITCILSNLNYTVTYSDWSKDTNPVEVSNSWNISRNFSEGDLIKLEITPPMDWGEYTEPPTSDIPFYYKPVFINITDPLQNETEILCYFVKIQENTPLVLYNVTVTETHGLSNVHYEIGLYGKNPGIVATTTLNGNYTAYIAGGLPGGSEPFRMRFLKGEKVSYQKYPYGELFYPSIATLFASAFLLYLGFRRPKKVYKRRVMVKEKH